MKKYLALAAAFFVLSSTAFGQFGYGQESKMSFGLFGGFALSQAKGTSSYADTWDSAIWRNISEYADIDYQAKNGVFFGGTFTYFFGPSFGIQVGGGMFGRNMPTETAAGWQAYGSGTWYSNEHAFSGGGKLSTIPLFLNFVGHFSAGMMDINLSAGPTLFLNKAEADATGLYGQSNSFWIYITGIGWVQFDLLDFLPVAMEVPSTSWTGFGANIGLSVDFNISPQFAVFLDARYFLCGSKDLDWEYIPGIYDGLEGTLSDWEFDQADVDYLVENELTTPLKINPSFFAVSGGVKIRFGR